MPIRQLPGGTVAECPRCDARSAVGDDAAARAWMAAHWRVHDAEIGCGRKTPAPPPGPAGG